MNLRNGNITIREIMNNPKGMLLMQREFPSLIGTPMFRMAQGMSLNKVIGHWGHHLPSGKVQSLIEELKRI